MSEREQQLERALREALEWYGEQADALCRYGGDLKPEAMEAVVTALMLDAGSRARAALAAPPAAPSGEYARAIEDAAVAAEAQLFSAGVSPWGAVEQIAAAIRSMAPAPREDARLAGLRHARGVLGNGGTKSAAEVAEWLNAEIARLSSAEPTREG